MEIIEIINKKICKCHPMEWEYKEEFEKLVAKYQKEIGRIDYVKIINEIHELRKTGNEFEKIVNKIIKEYKKQWKIEKRYDLRYDFFNYINKKVNINTQPEFGRVHEKTLKIILQALIRQ